MRTGTHAARVNGQEGGKFLPADLAVAAWFQHTSTTATRNCTSQLALTIR